MNILEIAVILLSVGLAVLGYYRGFVKKIAAMLSLVLSIVMVSAILPYMTDFLKNNTPVYGYIENQCQQVLEKQIVNVTDAGTYGLTEGSISLDMLQLTKIQQTDLIENLPVPGILQDMLLNYNNTEGYTNLAVSSFGEYIVNFIATMILNIISFIAATILVQILLRVAIMTMNMLSHIPMISGLNHFLGMLLGILEALFFLWIFFLILSAAVGTQTGLLLMEMVQKSRILGFLYNSNLFMQVVLRAVVLFAR